jgi:hypothetical protein
MITAASRPVLTVALAKKAVLTSRDSVTPTDLEAALSDLHLHA